MPRNVGHRLSAWAGLRVSCFAMGDRTTPTITAERATSSQGRAVGGGRRNRVRFGAQQLRAASPHWLRHVPTSFSFSKNACSKASAPLP